MGKKKSVSVDIEQLPCHNINLRRRKTCPFSSDPSLAIDYKDVRLLSRYISESGKIIPRRMTAVSAKKQREMTKAIKRAQHLALLRFAGTS
jgi:small subunit ribosomal protein S18